MLMNKKVVTNPFWYISSFIFKKNIYLRCISAAVVLTELQRKTIISQMVCLVLEKNSLYYILCPSSQLDSWDWIRVSFS